MVINVGDIIECKGIRAVVAKIAYQEYFPATKYEPEWLEVEFFDTNGIYRNWNKRYDGGMVIHAGDPLPGDVVMRG